MAGPVRIAILANGAQARREFDQTAASGSTMGKKFSATSALLKGAVVGGFVAAGYAAGRFATDSIKAASDSQQSIGATESVFGKFADSVIRKSKEAADAVGLSANEYRNLSNVLGATLRNTGVEDFAGQTEKLVNLGSDLAATFGGSTSDAVGALSAALRGEYDPLERYGVTLNETRINSELASKGLQGLTGDALTQAKQQARLNAIFDDSSRAQGQFARESDTLAGAQQRLGAKFDNLEASLGTAFLPLVTDVTSALDDGVTAASGFGDAIRDAQKGPNGTGDTILNQIVESSRDAVDALEPIKDGISSGFGEIGDSISDLLAEHGPMIRKLTDLFGDAGGAVAKFLGGQIGKDLELGLDLVGEGFEMVADNVQIAGNLFFDFSDIALSVTGTVVETVTDMAAGVIDGFLKIAEAADAIPGIDLKETIDSIESTRDSVEGFGDDFKDTADGIRSDLEKQQYLWNLTDKQAAEYKNVLLAMPQEVLTQINTPGAVDSYTEVRKLARQYDLTADQVTTTIRAAGVRLSLDQMRQLTRQYDLTPKQVRTLFKTQGIPASLTGLAQLQKKYGLVPKQLRTLAEVAGIDVSNGQLKGLQGNLEKVDKTNPHSKATADVGSANSDLDSLINHLAQVKSKTITVTTRLQTVHVGGSGGGGKSGRELDTSGRALDLLTRSTNRGTSADRGSVAPDRLDLVLDDGTVLRGYIRKHAIRAAADVYESAIGHEEFHG